MDDSIDANTSCWATAASCRRITVLKRWKKASNTASLDSCAKIMIAVLPLSSFLAVFSSNNPSPNVWAVPASLPMSAPVAPPNRTPIGPPRMPTSEPMRPPVHVPSTVLAVKSVLSAGIIRSFSFLTKTACATKASVVCE